MERAVALKKLSKLLGPKFGYRVDARAPMREERDRAREEGRKLNAEYNAADQAMTARCNEVLRADAEYQRLKAEAKRLKQAKDAAWIKTHHYKITVGTTGALFFHVRAQGDSWEEVIAEVSAKVAA